MTEESAGTSTEALRLVQQLTREAGHEIRNALNGVAVNVEVVRSRVVRDGPNNALLPFAERAVLQVGVVNTLTESLLSFVGCVLSAQADGSLRAIADGGAGSRLELMIYGDRAPALVSAIKRFGELTGVAVEEHNGRVILSLSSEGRSHPKE